MLEFRDFEYRYMYYYDIVEHHIEQQCLSIKMLASLYFYIGLKIRSTSKPHPIVPSLEIFGIFHFNKNQLSLVWRLLSFEHLRIPFILGFLILWKFDQWFYWKKSKYANFTGNSWPENAYIRSTSYRRVLIKISKCINGCLSDVVTVRSTSCLNVHSNNCPYSNDSFRIVSCTCCMGFDAWHSLTYFFRKVFLASQHSLVLKCALM